MKWSRIPPVAVLTIGVVGLVTASWERRAVAASQLPTTVSAASRPVDYNWDVRPILSENCFRCHGPDEKSRMAGLRLDVPDVAYAELKSGKGKHAIAPGNPGESELLRRVSAENPAARMPPPSVNKVLTADQIDTLTRWIAQGARYKPHWSFIAPQKPVPRCVDSRALGLSTISIASSSSASRAKACTCQWRPTRRR